VVVAQSSSGGVAIFYVLPVLWMMSCLAVVGRMVMRCDTGAECGVYECIVVFAVFSRHCLPKITTMRLNLSNLCTSYCWSRT